MTPTRHACTACGHIDKVHEPVERDGFVIYQNGLVTYHGKRVRVSPAARDWLYVLASCAPETITRATLLNRRNSMAVDRLVDVELGRVRKQFAAANIPCPIETIPKSGYCWLAAA